MYLVAEHLPRMCKTQGSIVNIVKKEKVLKQAFFKKIRELLYWLS
jgi:hypothetical protein